MINFKKQLRNIFGLFSIGILLAAVGAVLFIKEKNNSTPTITNPENKNFQKNQNKQNLDLISGTNSSRPVCNNLLEEDENSITLKEYSDANKVDCVFVGCGGIF